MSSLASQFGQSFSNHPLRMGFLRWQCRVRQMAMRDKDGRPYLRRMPASRPQRVCGAVLHTEAWSVPRPPARPRPNRPPRSTR